MIFFTFARHFLWARFRLCRARDSSVRFADISATSDISTRRGWGGGVRVARHDEEHTARSSHVNIVRTRCVWVYRIISFYIFMPVASLVRW